MVRRRVTVLVGPFGTGKSEIAVNLAIAEASRRAQVALMDLDLVKPFLRSREAKDWLEQERIRTVAPSGENAFADLPMLLPTVRSLLLEEDWLVIADVGGDEAGARVLGSLSDVLAQVGPDVLLVLNFRRPFVDNVERAVEMARTIERSSRTQVTGVISNTHLKEQTTVEIVREGYQLAMEVGERLGVPVLAVTAEENLALALDEAEFSCPIMRLRRILTLPFEKSISVRKSGPLFVLN